MRGSETDQRRARTQQNQRKRRGAKYTPRRTGPLLRNDGLTPPAVIRPRRRGARARDPGDPAARRSPGCRYRCPGREMHTCVRERRACGGCAARRAPRALHRRLRCISCIVRRCAELGFGRMHPAVPRQGSGQGLRSMHGFGKEGSERRGARERPLTCTHSNSGRLCTTGSSPWGRQLAVKAPISCTTCRNVGGVGDS